MSTKDFFPIVRYYTAADPYYYGVDNRPLTDLKSCLDFLADSFDTGSVGIENIRYRGAWTGSTSYQLNNLVIVNNEQGYIALSTHTSDGTFPVDLAGGKWKLLFSLNTSDINFNASGTGGLTEILQTALRRLVMREQYNSLANYQVARDAVSSTLGVNNLDVTGVLSFTSSLTPAAISSNQNDYNPAGLSANGTLRISSTARFSLTGLATGSAGRLLTIHNVGDFPIAIKNEDVGSTAINRFSFGHTLSGRHSMKIQYDGTTQRWRCIFRELPAGTLLDFAGGTVPEGFAACDGSNKTRTGITAPLYNELGTTWGVGDGSTTFGVPDSRRRVSVGSGGSGTGTLGNAVGNVGGAETHTLTAPQIPSHTHNLTGALVGLGTSFNTAGGIAIGNTTLTTDGGTGGGQAHNNMQPSYITTKMIKL